MCQKAVGGPFAALVVCENVTYTRGEPAYFESSNKVRRGFCSACGTPLTYEFEGGNLDITICSLDTPATVAPQEQLGTADRLPWCDGLSTLPERSGDTATAAQALFATIISHQHPDHDTPNQDTPNNTQA
ncbi:MAG: GFA family protein [Rhodobacteraceae bacterium]|nr:GFA family protein [Paracoccaceae bacterium]